MKCKMCGKYKHQDEFYTRTGSRKSYCRECSKKLVYAWKSKNKDRANTIQYKSNQKSKAIDIDCYVGGWKIAILNHTKVGESKYQAVNTNGKSFFTDIRFEFLDFLIDKI